jgi:activator of HSP90 ATPase
MQDDEGAEKCPDVGTATLHEGRRIVTIAQQKSIIRGDDCEVEVLRKGKVVARFEGK